MIDNKFFLGKIEKKFMKKYSSNIKKRDEDKF